MLLRPATLLPWNSNSSCCQSSRGEGVNDENNYDFPLTFKSWTFKMKTNKERVQRGFLMHCIFALKVAAVSKIVQFKWTEYIQSEVFNCSFRSLFHSNSSTKKPRFKNEQKNTFKLNNTLRHAPCQTVPLVFSSSHHDLSLSPILACLISPILDSL